MTIREAIDRLDRLTPNQYDNEEKVRWLSELDGVAHREILTQLEGDVPEFSGYGTDCDMDGTELLIPWPYDEIYRWYLEMKIADANGEIARCNNAAAKYNQYYTAYENDCRRRTMPVQRAPFFRL